MFSVSSIEKIYTQSHTGLFFPSIAQISCREAFFGWCCTIFHMLWHRNYPPCLNLALLHRRNRQFVGQGWYPFLLPHCRMGPFTRQLESDRVRAVVSSLFFFFFLLRENSEACDEQMLIIMRLLACDIKQICSVYWDMPYSVSLLLENRLCTLFFYSLSK